jgi:RNHCP domain
MRTSRKKLLRLDEKTHDQINRHFYDDEEDDYRSHERRKPRYNTSSDEVFKCKHCRRFVCPPPSGGRHRNHCPYCLYSRHVDDRKPGDRMSDCGDSMQPVCHFQRPNGEYVIVHHCHGCDFERFNRIAADDDFDLVLSLPAQPPRTSREVKALQGEMWLAQHPEQWELDVEEAV